MHERPTRPPLRGGHARLRTPPCRRASAPMSCALVSMWRCSSTRPLLPTPPCPFHSLALWRSRAPNADAAAIVGRAELAATPSSLLRVFSALASCALVFRTPRRSFSPREACRCRPRATVGELCRRGRSVARGQATSVHRGSSCRRRRVRAVPWTLSRPVSSRSSRRHHLCCRPNWPPLAFTAVQFV
jgi:hypothetical protein